jgi:HD superfamily phosphodiesterase
MDKKDRLVLEMMEFNRGNAKRIQHFVKVYELSRLIGVMEQLSDEEMEILEAAAIVHDIGIKVALEKYGEAYGKLQEKEGPPYAEKILEKLEYDKSVINRVSFLVGHHHTYDNIDGIDYQILVEADFLVNLCEKNSNEETVLDVYRKIFKTKSGKDVCQTMFGLSI